MARRPPETAPPASSSVKSNPYNHNPHKAQGSKEAQPQPRPAQASPGPGDMQLASPCSLGDPPLFSTQICVSDQIRSVTQSCPTLCNSRSVFSPTQIRHWLHHVGWHPSRPGPLGKRDTSAEGGWGAMGWTEYRLLGAWARPLWAQVPERTRWSPQGGILGKGWQERWSGRTLRGVRMEWGDRFEAQGRKEVALEPSSNHQNTRCPRLSSRSRP